MTRTAAGIDLLSPDRLFPPPGRSGALRFWLRYGLLHSVLLPLVLLRCPVTLFARLCAMLWVGHRDIVVFGGDLALCRVSRGRSWLTSLLFNEQFMFTLYKGLIIDPGPRCARAEVLVLCSRLARSGRLAGIVCTHLHEEHIGNAAALGRQLSLPVYATERTLLALRTPPRIAWYRALLMGQVEPAPQGADLRPIPSTIGVDGETLVIIDSPGHCEGHVSLYDPRRKILFAGDSFMGQIFTSPNEDFDAGQLIATLESYLALDIDLLVEAHGRVYSTNPDVPDIDDLVIRRTPREAIESKLNFLRWAQAVVAYGEKRGSSYAAIERCLFASTQRWVRDGFLSDGMFSQLSGGDFSRSHFVRSLAAHPERARLRRPLLASAVALSRRVLQKHAELVRIHRMALHPTKVGSIFLGLCLSLLGFVVVERWLPASVSAGPLYERPFVIAETLVAGHRAGLFLVLFAWLCLVWATIGGAATRRIALDLLGGNPSERGIFSCLRFCLKPSLLFPAALASAVFFFIVLARIWPWLLVVVLPVWLYAGLLYGPLTLEDCSLGEGIARVHRGLVHWREGVRLQLRLLVGFAVSTSLVYILTAVYSVAVMTFLDRVLEESIAFTSLVVVATVAPVVAYAVAYTTSNLKSLQVYLYLKLFAT